MVWREARVALPLPSCLLAKDSTGRKGEGTRAVKHTPRLRSRFAFNRKHASPPPAIPSRATPNRTSQPTPRGLARPRGHPLYLARVQKGGTSMPPHGGTIRGPPARRAASPGRADPSLYPRPGTERGNLHAATWRSHLLGNHPLAARPRPAAPTPPLYPRPGTERRNPNAAT